MLKKVFTDQFLMVSITILIFISTNMINAENNENIDSNLKSRYFDSRNISQSINDTDNDNTPDELDDDDDNDGMPDYWENEWSKYSIEKNLQFQFDTKNASDANEDWDGDGYSNLNEYLSETNPFDKEDTPKISHATTKNEESWARFLAFLVLAVFGMMAISIIIGIYIIKKRKEDEEFWTQAFGTGNGGMGLDGDDQNILRDRFLEWQRKIEPNKAIRERNKQRVKLEIIGGPDLDSEIKHDATKGGNKGPGKRKEYKEDPRFKGKYCLWCSHAITNKYIKRCTGMRTSKKRCQDGPFCSKRCLNEHIRTVPHFNEVEF